MSPGRSATDGARRACSEALGRARQFLERTQDQAGFWWDEDASLPAADRALIRFWLGRVGTDAPLRPADGLAGVSEAVRSYCALRVSGLAAEDPVLKDLRESVVAQGGLDAADSATRLFLSRFGVCPHPLSPAAPGSWPAGLPELKAPINPWRRLLGVFEGRRKTLEVETDPFAGPIEQTAAAALALPEESGSQRRSAEWLSRHGASTSVTTTALCLLALRKGAGSEAGVVEKLLQHLTQSQNKDGWRTAGATGAALEALCAWGRGLEQLEVRRAVNWLLEAQKQDDGSWLEIRATGQALRGLRAAGHAADEVAPLRATEWLRSIQNADGSWGEEGGPSAAATAWALLGLLAGQDTTSESVRQGLGLLISTQDAGGGWGGATAWCTLALAEACAALAEER